MKTSTIGIYALATAGCGWLAANAALAAVGTPPQQSLKARGILSELPLWFEANQGQTDSEIKFLAHGTGYAIFFTATNVTLALNPSGTKSEGVSVPSGQRRSPDAKGLEHETVLRVWLSNANSGRVAGRELLLGKSHY